MNTSEMHSADTELKAHYKQLKDGMDREVRVMRELLGNMREEQDALLVSNPANLKRIMQEREPLMTMLLDCRTKRLNTLQTIAHTQGIDANADYSLTPEAFETLCQDAHDDGCTILNLREQIVALLTQVKKQSARNNYLIENKVAMTKELIRRLYPDDKQATYSKDGTVGQRNRVATVTIINKEV